VGREQKLTTSFRVSQLGNNSVSNKCVIQVVLRLVHDQWVSILQQQHVEDSRTLLTSRKSIQSSEHGLHLAVRDIQENINSMI